MVKMCFYNDLKQFEIWNVTKTEKSIYLICDLWSMLLLSKMYNDSKLTNIE